MIGCCRRSNVDAVMKSLLVVVEVHKSLPKAEVKNSTTFRTCFAARVVDGTAPILQGVILGTSPIDGVNHWNSTL